MVTQISLAISPAAVIQKHDSPPSSHFLVQRGIQGSIAPLHPGRQVISSGEATGSKIMQSAPLPPVYVDGSSRVAANPVPPRRDAWLARHAHGRQAWGRQPPAGPQPIPAPSPQQARRARPRIKRSSSGWALGDFALFNTLSLPHTRICRHHGSFPSNTLAHHCTSPPEMRS